MRIYLLTLFLATAAFCYANMASPVNDGTKSATVFTSKDMNILSEKINIKVDHSFRYAKYTIEYRIQAVHAEKQFPLLFYAMDYKREFKVWVDGKEVNLQSGRDVIQDRSETDSLYARFYRNYQSNSDDNCVLVKWDKFESRCIPIEDLKYFETALSEGEHTIRVEYFGSSWVDRSEIIEKSSFRYSLSPANYWKSFGTLDLTIDATDCDKQLFYTFDYNRKKLSGKVTHLHFDKLPGEYILVEYTPKMSAAGTFWVSIGPFWLALFSSFVLMVLHVYITEKSIHWNLYYIYEIMLVAGSLIMSLVFTLSYCQAQNFIDSTIGENASRYHGYSFLLVVFVPLVWPVYGVILYQVLKEKVTASRKLRKYDKD